MASFKYLVSDFNDKNDIFFALTVYTVAAEQQNAREKKHASIAGVPPPLLAYPYAYAALPASYPEDDGSYWPGKYENTITEVAKTVYSSHPEDDGSYWPGKYDNSELPAYPVVYRHY